MAGTRGLRPSSLVFEQTARAAARPGAIWGYVFGAFVASSAWSYSSIYKTPADRQRLAATFGHNTATIALFGPASDLQTMGGFTVFKVSMTAMVIGAVWGLLTGTRLLRGEEDASRWDLYLAGRSTRRGATAQALAGLFVAAFLLWMIVSLVTALAGISPKVAIPIGPALFLGLALACPALMFLAVGALTSQLVSTRRQAAGAAAVVLGVSYSLRLVGDAGIGVSWLTWLSPLGWAEKLAPLTSNDPVPFALIGFFTLVTAVAAILIAGRRDVGAGLIPDSPGRSPRLRLLGNATGLALRLVGPVALAWLATLAVVGLLFGMVARGAGDTISGSSVHEVLDRLGATGTGVRAYLGVVFLTVAVLLGFAAAGQVGALRAEEAEGRLDNLLAQPLGRTRWLASRVGVGLALVLTAGVAAAVFTWIGTVTQPDGVGVGSLLASGVNAVVPAIVLIGVGIFLMGFWPRVTSAGMYVVLAWSLLIELVGGVGAINHWLLDTSVFHHVRSSPAVPPNWSEDGILVGIGLVGAALGFGRFSARDLEGQ